MKKAVVWDVKPRGSSKNQEPHDVTFQKMAFFFSRYVTGGLGRTDEHSLSACSMIPSAIGASAPVRP
jgi:hypothetical protein